MRGIISGFDRQPQKRHWISRLMIIGLGAIATYGLFKLPVQAATFGIFNRLPSGYYNQGRQSPTHNVLPPIYNYNEQLESSPGYDGPAAYAIDVH